MKKVIALMVVFAMFLAGCTKVVYVEVTPAPTFTPAVAPTSTPEPTAAPTESEAVEAVVELDPETILAALKTGLPDSDGLTYEFEYNPSGKVYIIYVTADGLATLALSAKSGDAGSIAAWDEYVQSLCGLNSAMLKYIQAVGSDASLSFIVRNDANPENSLASTLNAVVVYDVTK